LAQSPFEKENTSQQGRTADPPQLAMPKVAQLVQPGVSVGDLPSKDWDSDHFW